MGNELFSGNRILRRCGDQHEDGSRRRRRRVRWWRTRWDLKTKTDFFKKKRKKTPFSELGYRPEGLRRLQVSVLWGRGGRASAAGWAARYLLFFKKKYLTRILWEFYAILEGIKARNARTNILVLSLGRFANSVVGESTWSISIPHMFSFLTAA